ncbi:hypothetical protein HG537_0H00320 [Torulaspora globosa]|uniref:C2H2-type domain-containing protein n=1 Tax=Torulaspora globosa TaxID=48254 RepID=A0A7H9HXZ0_9SACH|nr:hypothetical protein HG537_0H00320 [Torulaspora sp. CBS 2947]
MSSRSPSNQENVQPAAGATSNNMNSKVNKHMGQLPENLRLNGKTPSGKPRLFVCQICTRAFARQEHLTRHERSHTKEKPYSCGICNRNFSRRDLLLRHANKIHGGNFGDTIIKHNKNGASKVSKRRQSTGVPSELGKQGARRPNAHSTMMKRRASYSAQSGAYVAPVQNQENHKFDRVRFSTPELLPIDLKEIRDENYSQDVKSDLEDLYLESNDSNLPQTGAQASFGSPNDFNLLDNVNWINDYNNEPFLPTSETGTGTDTTKTRTATTTNSANISPDLNHANFSLEAALTNAGSGMNIRSSWSVDEVGGNLQVKSLFSTVSPSSSSKDNSVLPNSSAANSTPWLRSSSEQVTSNDSKKSPSFSRSATVPGGVSEKPTNLQFEENVENLLHNRVSYEHCNLQELKETEELQNFEPMPIDQVSLLNQLENRQIEDLKSVTNAPDNDYTTYGLDYLTLSHITRVTSESNEERVSKLPTSDIFTPELRQMCIDASRYYGEHYYDNYVSGGGADRARISKELLLPSCRELNMYVSYFREFFNSHHPVIHPDFFNLNLKALKIYVHEGYAIDEESDRHLQYSNVVCLPLFVATVGSLFKPEPDANTITLYETSRRILHVFLERRKEQQQSSQGIKPMHRSGQHVWLIQSLSLSIIYSLFADHMGKINAEMMKRQVSAVCSIIKNNFLRAISYDTLTRDSDSSRDSGNQGISNSGIDTSFSYIMFESKIRCTLSAYKFCQFLRIFYNVETKLFLSEQDIEPICIPDDENTWNRASLLLPQQPMTKSNVTSFRKFYDSFTFNHSGMKPIPESLASIMLYYEFNISTHSTFHVFLTRIDTKKLEKNLAQIQSQLHLDSLESNYTAVLRSDSIVLRNCLMTMYFLLRIDRNIGTKFWQGRMNELFDSFINPRSMTILAKGSYSLLSDFLVALNSSIKNLVNVFKLNHSKTSVYLNNKVTSMFNLQAYHNDFLVLLKFIMDFEYKPNFKLLCIFTELKRLADRLLIPFLSQKYPLEFSHFEDVSMTNNFIQQNADFLPESFHHYSSINVEELEKLINNVLVYSFNDSSFLKMSEQLNNEFPFNNDHPTYDPFDFTLAESFLPSEATADTSNSEMAQDPSDLMFDDQVKAQPTFSKSFTELSSWMPDKQSLDHSNNVNGYKQGFGERYRLSEKYVVIAKCFFTFVRERYVNCHILDRMTNDFKQLQVCLEKQRERYQPTATKFEDIYKDEDVSHLNSLSGSSTFDRVSTQ